MFLAYFCILPSFMCAKFTQKKKAYQPGTVISAFSEAGAVHLTWAGFARSEILHWWQNQGAKLIDIPADTFAERSDLDRQLTWQEIPSSLVIRGLIDSRRETPLIKIITRAATCNEFKLFQHPRMPLLLPPLFSSHSSPSSPSLVESQ